MALTAGSVACEQDSLVARATLSVEPKAIDFGEVPSGKSRTVELRLRNGAPNRTLNVEAITLLPGSAEVFAAGEVAAEIEGGGEAVVPITYTPDDAEPDAGHLEILSDAIDQPRIVVPLTSARTTAEIAVRPPVLDLGSLLAGGESAGTVQITSAGNATLEVSRISLRTIGFRGEVCERDADCHEGRCTGSRTGPICAPACTGDGDCASGYACTTGADGYRGCRETEQARPPVALRGFEASFETPLSLLPEASERVLLTYRPAPSDRGSVTLVIESNDVERPVLAVPILGLLENLPPTAVADFDGAPPAEPVDPGARITVTGRDSFDPEGDALTYRWRFVVRPEGSRATFADASGADTSFAVDRPGAYVVELEVKDPSGLVSTNDARVEVSAGAGTRVRAELAWDRPGTDLDLHLVSPGAPVGSAGDCFFDNPNPDWTPPGPGGDPTFTATTTAESISLEGHADGTYTLLVEAVASSPQGPTGATLRLYLDDVEVAVFSQTLPTSAGAWDVATLTWPSGRIVGLDTVR